MPRKESRLKLSGLKFSGGEGRTSRALEDFGFSPSPLRGEGRDEGGFINFYPYADNPFNQPY